MLGTKYLSDYIDEKVFIPGKVNLIETPCGSGKSTWALNYCSSLVKEGKKVVYLIDTANGRDQFLREENTMRYTREWLEEIEGDIVYFSSEKSNGQFVVMTYAHFGYLSNEHRDFGFAFEAIICDELHNLFRYEAFANQTGINPHRIARERLEEIVNSKESNVKVIGMTATPRLVEDRMDCWIWYPAALDDDILRYETIEKIPYSSFISLLPLLDKEKKGIVYTERITGMQVMEAEARARGFRTISLWSINSKDHSMNKTQIAARNHMIQKQELPPDYDLVFINAAYETGINIRGNVDYIVIHNQEPDTITQVRGRYRGDLEKMYVLDYDTDLIVPPEFMGRRLFKEDKSALCAIVKKRNKSGNIVGWPTVKKELIRLGYTVAEGRTNDKRYAVITL